MENEKKPDFKRVVDKFLTYRRRDYPEHGLYTFIENTCATVGASSEYNMYIRNICSLAYSNYPEGGYLYPFTLTVWARGCLEREFFMRGRDEINHFELASIVVRSLMAEQYPVWIPGTDQDTTCPYDLKYAAENGQDYEEWLLKNNSRVDTKIDEMHSYESHIHGNRLSFQWFEDFGYPADFVRMVMKNEDYKIYRMIKRIYN